jgi:putative ABC transport system substrate-binding protein
VDRDKFAEPFWAFGQHGVCPYTRLGVYATMPLTPPCASSACYDGATRGGNLMPVGRTNRRAFIAGLSGAVAWPLVARAQQPAMPVIGFLSALVQATTAPDTATVRLSLAEAGYVEGHNLGIEYRFAEGQYDRLPTMASELLRRQVAVIVAMGTPAALAAKAATASLPIVFSVTEDPVNLGLVASIARPGGNATGVSFLLSELAPKQLGLLRELLPAASRFGLLVNPKNENAETITRDLKAAAAKISVEISVVQASNSREIEAAFAALVCRGDFSPPPRVFPAR